MDEFDELEIETIAAAHYYDDEDHCLDEGDGIDEFDNICETDSTRHGHYHQHNSGGGGCLIIVLTGVVITICTASLLVLSV